MEQFPTAQHINRSALWLIVGTIGAAIIALLVYSLDRTSWLFRLYETGQPHAQGLGLAAAIVVELACVGMIAGESVAALLPDERTRTAVRTWASWGLVSVLSVQVIANLLAGYLRGTSALASELTTAHIASGWQYSLISGVTWFTANSLIPFLIFGLSKMEANVIRLLMVTPSLPEPTSILDVVREEPSSLFDGLTTPLLDEVRQTIHLSNGHQLAPLPAAETGTQPSATSRNGSYDCPNCGASLTLAQYGAACKHGHCRACRNTKETTTTSGGER
jgi:hypothetical protein